MKTKYLVISGLACMAITTSQAQFWNRLPGGNNINAAEWLGADVLSTVPLRIETRANQPIDWYTNADQRMRLSPNVTSFMGPQNQFPGVQRDGYLLLSGEPDAFTNAGSRAPFTRLHLIDQTGTTTPSVYAQEHGFRPWQRNGITLTGNSDQGYVGQKYGGDDNTDFVVQWSDNPDSSPWGTDRLKFLFTTEYDPGAAKGAATLNGVEAMRFWPKDNLNVNVGVGDFAPPAVGDPTERLDILDGRLRIRQLPDDLQTTEPFKVMVVDDTVDPERGVVKWVPASAIASAADCEWSMTAGTNPGDNDVWTTEGAETDNCPDQTEGVGIGIINPAAKLDVVTGVFSDGLHVNSTTATGNVRGAYIQASGGTAGSAGIVAEVTGGSPSNVGLASLASGAATGNTGVLTAAFGSGVNNTGVSVTTNGASTSNTGVVATVTSAAVTNRGIRLSTTGATTSNIAVDATAGGTSTTNTGLLSSVSGGTSSNLGADIVVSGGSSVNTGLRSSISGSTTNNIGVSSTVRGSVNGANNGVYADVFPENGVNMDYANGVVANVTDPSIGASAIYGNVQLTQGGNAAAQMQGVYGNVRASAGNYQYVYGTRGVVSSSGATLDRQYGAYGSAGGNSTMSASYGLWGLSQISGVVNSNYGAQTTAYWEQGATIDQNIGLRATSEPVLGVTSTVPLSYGVIATARAGQNRTYGVYSTGWSGGTDNYGVYGRALSGTNSNYSIYGDFAGTGANDYAGYFNGRTHINGVASCPAMAWTSDASIKTDVEDITGATELLAQVRPRSYRFLSQQYPTMNLPEGEQLGVIAQELESVLPELVQEIRIGACLDTAGHEISPAATIKGVNYIGLIPLLISAVQEQTARITALESDLASCCDANSRSTASTDGQGVLETDLRIIPNPVADRTELRYTMGAEGRVRLEITDASGRMIQVQDEGLRATGTFSFGWDTTVLSPGTYFCTFYVNGEPLVKKAVKLNVR